MGAVTVTEARWWSLRRERASSERGGRTGWLRASAALPWRAWAGAQWAGLSGGGAGIGADSGVAAGTRPTSAGSGGGSLPPSREGSTAIAARAAAAIAAALPALDHLIRHPAIGF